MKKQCHTFQAQMVELLTGELPQEEAAALRDHVVQCSMCRSELESLQQTWQKLSALPPEAPPHGMEERFDALLLGYQRALSRAELQNRAMLFDVIGSFLRQPVWKMALVVLLLIAGYLLGSFSASKKDDSRFAALSNQMDDMRQLVMLSLLKQESSIDRLQAVNWSYQVQQPREQVRDLLRQTLVSDPNVNVRLAALRALAPYAGDSLVRRDIVNSFPTQTSPLVQTEIIDFIRRNEARPVDLLNILAQQDHLNPMVKQHLEWTIGTLVGKTFYKEINNEKDRDAHRILPLPADNKAGRR